MRETELEAVLANLREHYTVINREKFDGVLPDHYRIELNPYLRRLTGRITYSMRLIEISRYHLSQYGVADARATLEHEMLHLYLHTLGQPSGHNNLFKKLAVPLGIRVFHDNPYPKNQSPRHRYVYRCPSCDRMVFRKRRRDDNTLACGVCCRAHAGGGWDNRFALQLLDKVKFA